MNPTYGAKKPCYEKGLPRPLRTTHYYLLDLGFRVRATVGLGFPWCGQDHGPGPVEHSARIGNTRFHVKTAGPLTHESWKRGLAAVSTTPKRPSATST